MAEFLDDPMAEYRKVNVEGTLRFAEQAASSGVKRFIYLSTIKVNGEQSTGKPFSAEDSVNPLESYAISKWEAEKTLKEIGSESGMEIVIIRPSLVYGAGVKGNFLRLLKLVETAYPIPLGAVVNKRSMVNLDNLCDLIRVCIDHPKAGGETFLVSDNHDLSIACLIRLIADSMQRPARLISLPVSWLYGVSKIIGKKSEMERLCESLQVDIQKTIDILEWIPPCSVEAGVRKTVTWFQNQKR